MTRYTKTTGRLNSKSERRALECLRHAGEHCNDRGDYTAAEWLYRLWSALVSEGQQ